MISTFHQKNAPRYSQPMRNIVNVNLKRSAQTWLIFIMLLFLQWVGARQKIHSSAGQDAIRSMRLAVLELAIDYVRALMFMRVITLRRLAAARAPVPRLLSHPTTAQAGHKSRLAL